MWYYWSQNNSGGSFFVDDKLTHRVFIEADTYREAESKALYMGVYYNGCDEGLDCECCGDRWYEGDEVPVPNKIRRWDSNNAVDINTVEEYAQYLADKYGWCKPDARLFYKNGEVKEIFKTKVKK